MQDLIPPSKPLPQSQQYFEPRWNDAPEIEYAPVPPRRSRWGLYSASAAALLLTLGVGWASADRIGDLFGPPKPDPIAVKAAEAFHAAQTQGRELAALRVHVENLKSRLESQVQKSRSEETTIANLQKSLADAKANAAATTSQLQAKLEKVQSEAEKAAQKPVDKTPTASIARPLPRPTQTQTAASAAPASHAVAGPYRAFVLRDVGGGRAIVEGAGRMEEVEPGDILPGGAMVERIERRGQTWVVRTSRGYIGPEFMIDD
ncbi:MAG TPA: hypothetical protein VMU18_07730 [Rhodoblastus sp.]|nr:hypothetical protein [Rhodoblastus sp.]